MSMSYTCEGCETSPPQVTSLEANDDHGNWVMTTLCPDCFRLADTLQRDHPIRIALINRIVDFKEAWPLKAKVNGLGYAASLMDKDDQIAIEFVQRVVKGNFTRPLVPLKT